MDYDRRVGFRGIVNRIVGSSLCPIRLRTLVLRAYGLSIGPGGGLMERCFIGGNDIVIGDRTTVNVGCVFDNSARITIGRNCRLGLEVMLVTSSHIDGGPGQRAGIPVSSPITIGDGVWIASRVTVLPGVSIGDGCIVAAGAVVVSDCERNTLYAGVPARRVRHLSDSHSA